MISKQKENVLATANALKEVEEWFDNRSSYDWWMIEKSYAEICRIGKVWREYFSYKGIYKIIRRHYIRHTVQYYLTHPWLLGCLSIPLAREILDKSDQGWLPRNKKIGELITLVSFKIDNYDRRRMR